MNSLFQQKQRELVLAVSKVEELSRQLEMLKNGRMDGRHDSRSAAAELDRLYKELQVRPALGAQSPRKQLQVQDFSFFSLKRGGGVGVGRGSQTPESPE